MTVAALLPVGLLAVTSVAVASSQVTAEVNRRVTATAALSAVFVGEQTAGLKALVHSYATRPTLLSDFTAGSAGAGRVQAQLASLAGSGGGVTGAFATDARGSLTAVYPAAPKLIGRSFAYRDWYRGLATQGGPYVSVAYQTALAGHPLVVGPRTTSAARPAPRSGSSPPSSPSTRSRGSVPTSLRRRG